MHAAVSSSFARSLSALAYYTCVCLRTESVPAPYIFIYNFVIILDAAEVLRDFLYVQRWCGVAKIMATNLRSDA